MNVDDGSCGATEFSGNIHRCQVHGLNSFGRRRERDTVQPSVIVVHAVEEKVVVLGALTDGVDAEVAPNAIGTVALEVAALLAARDRFIAPIEGFRELYQDLYALTFVNDGCDYSRVPAADRSRRQDIRIGRKIGRLIFAILIRDEIASDYTAQALDGYARLCGMGAACFDDASRNFVGANGTAQQDCCDREFEQDIISVS